MEIWIDERHSIENRSVKEKGIDRRIFAQSHTNKNDYFVDGHRLIANEKVVGALVTIDSEETQDYARSLVGSVGWLVLSFSNWSMIPIENLVAACENTPTQIAAVISTPEQAQGAGFALQRGVEALVISPSEEMVEAALVVKSQRLERRAKHTDEITPEAEHVGLGKLTITSVEPGGTAERYCIDMTRLLEDGEGLLLGSSASSFLFVHGETLDSEFVPTRPFRVNAGPPHAYIRMSSGQTKYLSELQSGDEIHVVSTDGKQRSATVGRLKIELRPMILVKWIDENNKEGNMFLQQAETVRVVGVDKKTKSITGLKPGDLVIGWSEMGSRHIGAPISSAVTER